MQSEIRKIREKEHTLVSLKCRKINEHFKDYKASSILKFPAFDLNSKYFYMDL